MTEHVAASRYVVTGAAGFVGSHLCEALLRRGHEVVGVDDLSSGRRSNLTSFGRHPAFSFREADVNEGVPVRGPVDGVFHLITPTPATTLIDAGSARLPPLPTGVDQVGEFALRRSCRLLLVGATGTEYEDPFERAPDPQVQGETWALGSEVRVARLFSAYGPRMEPEDEPTLMHLLLQAATGQPLVITGGAEQTVSLCFVSDLVNGLLRLFRGNVSSIPIDLGDGTQHRVDEVAQLIRTVTGADVPIEHRPGSASRLQLPRPDTIVSAEQLGWAPRVPLAAGLRTTAAWLHGELGPTVGGTDAGRHRRSA